MSHQRRHEQTHYMYNNVKHTIAAVTGSSTAISGVISDEIYTVRILAAEDTYITFETNEAASSTNGVTVKGGVIEYFKVSPGEKINARAVATNNTVEICEMT